MPQQGPAHTTYDDDDDVDGVRRWYRDSVIGVPDGKEGKIIMNRNFLY